MNAEEIDVLLSDGIKAAKDGDVRGARELLILVVDRNPDSELAWLWLSSVLDDPEDRLLCLQNVLVLDPGNAAAKRGIGRLKHQLASTSRSDATGDNFVKAASPVTAILYPHRLHREVPREDHIPLHRVRDTEFKIRSDYDDVWEDESDICAYCASQVSALSKRCPNCHRKLSVTVFRYPRSSSEFTIYYVLLIGIAELFLFTAILKVLIRDSIYSVAWNGLLFVVVGLLVIGVVFRRVWAYPVSIVVLLTLFFSMMFSFLAGSTPGSVLAGIVGDDLVTFLSSDLNNAFFRATTSLVEVLQFAAVLLALVYGIFKIGPDFERVQIRRIARLDIQNNDPSSYYAAGQAFAEEGMWASAVLHWRRAAALDPGRAFYQRRLGEGYARLGFYQRSLDVLKSSLELSTDQVSRSETMEAIKQVRIELSEDQDAVETIKPSD